MGRRPTYPAVPGHEIIGRVVKTGKDVTPLQTRASASASAASSTRAARAPSCKGGHENYCQIGLTMTYGSIEADGVTPTFGGYSRTSSSTSISSSRFPRTRSGRRGAAAVRGHHDLLAAPARLALKKGSRVAVMGLGGLGHMGVKLAASFGAEVTVLSRSPEKEADATTARRAGIRADQRRRERSRRWPGGTMPCSTRFPRSTTSRGALNVLKPDGTLILVGASPEPLEFNPFPLLVGGRKIVGSLVGGVPDTQAMLDHCGTHGIVSDIEMITPDGSTPRTSGPLG